MVVSRRASRQVEELDNHYSGGKNNIIHKEEYVLGESTHEAAERGHTATDRYVFLSLAQPPTVTDLHRYGNALVHIDPVAEAKLRLKIDLMVVPVCAHLEGSRYRTLTLTSDRLLDVFILLHWYANIVMFRDLYTD